jgi:hypothetical protein
MSLASLAKESRALREASKADEDFMPMLAKWEYELIKGKDWVLGYGPEAGINIRNLGGSKTKIIQYEQFAPNMTQFISSAGLSHDATMSTKALVKGAGIRSSDSYEAVKKAILTSAEIVIDGMMEFLKTDSANITKLIKPVKWMAERYNPTILYLCTAHTCVKKRPHVCSFPVSQTISKITD